MGQRSIWVTSQVNRMPHDPLVVVRELVDLYGWFLSTLANFADSRRLPATVSPHSRFERTCPGQCAVPAATLRTNRRCRPSDRWSACLGGVGQGHLDPRPDRAAIGLHSNQFEADPVVAVTGVLKQPHSMAIARFSASEDVHDVLIAAVVQVGECNSVSSVQIASTRRCGDIDEVLSIVIAQQNFGTREA